MKKTAIAGLFAVFGLTVSAEASTIDVTFTAHDAVPINIEAYLDLNYSVSLTEGDYDFNFTNIIIDWGDGTQPVEDPWGPGGTHYTFAHLYAAEGSFTIVATVFGTVQNDGENSCTGIPNCVLLLDGRATAPITILPAVAVTPVPAALPLFATALGGLGFVTWRRRRA